MSFSSNAGDEMTWTVSPADDLEISDVDRGDRAKDEGATRKQSAIRPWRGA